ncbi:MAG: Asp23/Gls24 family envelope stress response protein [Bacilli bacterium]|jgi:uncharacterized alkaline shock family protein YloU|nr:Asp23/Gls24 family envelope stress response protein [Candidatus Saccharimonadaceae bacterium]NCA94781.1 Asp23/Gls24 family envelope stress response protein [Campylobacterota bacterium]
MADYVYIENYSKYGVMGISRRVFETIAQTATNRVKGATVSANKSRLFTLHRPIQAILRSNGLVDIRIDVAIKSGVNVSEVCLKIQEEVANALMAMTEMVPFNINIKVASIQ